MGLIRLRIPLLVFGYDLLLYSGTILEQFGHINFCRPEISIMRALKTLKMLWFPVLRLWAQPEWTMWNLTASHAFGVSLAIRCLG